MVLKRENGSFDEILDGILKPDMILLSPWLLVATIECKSSVVLKAAASSWASCQQDKGRVATVRNHPEAHSTNCLPDSEIWRCLPSNSFAISRFE